MYARGHLGNVARACSSGRRGEERGGAPPPFAARAEGLRGRGGDGPRWPRSPCDLIFLGFLCCLLRFASICLAVAMAGECGLAAIGSTLPVDARARFWCFVREVGIEDVDDLAFFFTTVEAAAASGQEEAWRRARQLAGHPRVAAWHRVAREAQSAPPARKADAPPRALAMVLPGLRPPRGGRGAQRAAASASGTEEADAAQRASAAGAAVQLSAPCLARGLPEGQAQRLCGPGSAAAKRLARFASAGVRDALRVWARWEAWARARQLEPLSAEAAGSTLMVDEFICHMCGEQASGVRVWNRLKWLQKYLGAPFALEDAMKPDARPASKAGGELRQATVLEPCMVSFLHQILAAQAAQRGWLEVPAAAAIALCHGWLRFQHLSRSYPIERTRALAWFRCYRGKRGGCFDWCLVRTAEPRCAADVLWDAWHKRAGAAGEGAPLPRGLAAHEDTGQLWRLAHFSKFLQSEIGLCLNSPLERKLITSYSLRRFMPTLAESVQLPWTERVVGGGWTPRDGGGSAGAPNMMPLRYAGTRREQQGFVRLYMHEVFHEAVASLPAPLRFEGVKAWWDTPAAQEVAAGARRRAMQLLAAQGAPEPAKFLPPAVKKELARRRFGAFTASNYGEQSAALRRQFRSRGRRAAQPPQRPRRAQRLRGIAGKRALEEGEIGSDEERDSQSSAALPVERAKPAAQPSAGELAGAAAPAVGAAPAAAAAQAQAAPTSPLGGDVVAAAAQAGACGARGFVIRAERFFAAQAQAASPSRAYVQAAAAAARAHAAPTSALGGDVVAAASAQAGARSARGRRARSASLPRRRRQRHRRGRMCSPLQQQQRCRRTQRRGGA